MSYFFITCLLIFTNAPGWADALRMTLYEHSYYNGELMTVDVSGCRNVLEFNDRASSIKTDGCLRAWEHISCSGKYIELSAPGADHLPHRNFNDMITSVSDCSYGGNGNGAVAVAGDKVIINMDTSRAPELNDFGRKVKKVMEDWFPFVQTLMTTSAYTPVTKIDVVFDPNYDGVAYAAGTTIVGAVKYFKDHQDDFGAFIHEMTHAVHQARGCPSWVVEGFAEWTRRWFYEPWTAKQKPRATESYRSGYSNAAWFLVYVTSKVTDKPVMYHLNKACQEGTWRDSIFEELTGKSADQLWNEMVNDQGYPWK